MNKLFKLILINTILYIFILVQILNIINFKIKMKSIININKYFSKVANDMKQLKNGEFAKSFDPDNYQKLSGIITKLGGKQIKFATDYMDTSIVDYQLGNDRVTIFINEPWDMTVSSHNSKLIEEVASLMYDTGNKE